MSENANFLQAYSKLVARTWASDEYLDALKNHPHNVLSEIGLEIPADADVEVRVVAATGDGKIEDQIARWEKGQETGFYEIVIAERPEDFDIEDMELSDAQLDAVAGGDYYCCCCTPCCCCS